MGSFKSKRFAVFFSALSAVLLSLSDPSPASAEPAELDGWTIDARRPEYLNEDELIGEFTVEREIADADETRGAGTCLVADLHGNFACETRDDCLQAQADGLLLPSKEDLEKNGGYLYCEAFGGEAAKRCLTRPTGKGCTRGPRTLLKGDFLNLYSILAPNSSGTVSITGLAAVYPNIDGKRILWATLACLAVKSNPTGCGSEDPSQHIYSVSPALDPGLPCDEETNACAPVCGDGFVREPEACDDGNLDGGDGCSADCSTEADYTCEGEPSICTADEPTPPDGDDVDPDDDGEDSGVGGGPTGTPGLGGGGCSLMIRK